MTWGWQPAAKVSMTNMRPPQQGQGSASGCAGSVSLVCSAAGGARFKSLRAAAMVSARLLPRRACRRWQPLDLMQAQLLAARARMSCRNSAKLSRLFAFVRFREKLPSSLPRLQLFLGISSRRDINAGLCVQHPSPR